MKYLKYFENSAAIGEGVEVDLPNISYIEGEYVLFASGDEGEKAKITTDSIVLADKEVYPIEEDTVVRSVSYTRTYSTNVVPWILPCDMVFTQAMADLVDISKIDPLNTYIDYKPGDTEWNTNLHLIKVGIGEVIKANTPYIIQGKESGTFNFISTQPYVFLKKMYGEITPDKAPQYIIDKGTYNICFIPVQTNSTKLYASNYPDGLFYVSGGKLVRSTGTVTVSSYRWVIYLQQKTQ